MDNPLAPSIIELHRERILTELSRIRQEGDKTPTPQEVEALFNKAAYLSNKANILAKAISQAAEKFYIPVDPEAIEVVAAVKRKSADSQDGLRISFDLFKDAVKASQQTRKDLEETVILSQSITTGSVLQKRIRKIRARASIMVASGVEPDDDVLEMLISQFLILWLAHELMKPFENAKDHLQLAQTWVEKESGGSEAVIAINILIGIAIQLIIMGLNDDLMEKYLNEAAGGNFPRGMNAKTIIGEARAFERNKAMAYAEMMAGLNDYELILRYSFEFLQNTIDPGYDMWTSYVEVVNMRYTAQSLWVQAPHYSVSHAIVTQNFSNPTKNPKNWNKIKGVTTTSFTGPDLPYGGSALAFGGAATSNNELVKNTFQQTIVNSLVPMAPISYVARTDVLNGIDSNLDVIAQVLSSDFAQEVACCLGAFLGKLDPGILKAIRAMLEGLLRAYSFDLGNALKAMLSHLVNPNFEEILALVAMQQIDKIFDKLIEKVLGLFGEDIRALLCCPFIGEMIQKVLEGIVRLENELKSAVKIFTGKLMESTGLGNTSVMFRAEKTYDKRVIRKMIMILDAIIRAVESLDACADHTKMFSPLPESVRHAIQLPTITIREDDKNNYFITALPRELSNGKFLPALGERIESLLASAVTDAMGRVSDRHSCGGSFNEESLRKAAAAFRPSTQGP